MFCCFAFLPLHGPLQLYLFSDVLRLVFCYFFTTWLPPDDTERARHQPGGQTRLPLVHACLLTPGGLLHPRSSAPQSWISVPPSRPQRCPCQLGLRARQEFELYLSLCKILFQTTLVPIPQPSSTLAGFRSRSSLTASRLIFSSSWKARGKRVLFSSHWASYSTRPLCRSRPGMI